MTLHAKYFNGKKEQKMNYYVGLDISLDQTSVCIVDHDGNFIKEGTVLSDPDSIAKYLHNTPYTFERIGLEAGPTSSWLYKGLSDADFNIFCIETRHAKAAMRAQNVKTDKNDARGLAHIMRTGWFKAVHVKSSESQKVRVLLNNRKTLVTNRLAIESQIRGSLKVFGLKIGKISPRNYEARVRELVADDPELESYINPLLKIRIQIFEEHQKLEKMIIKIAHQDRVCRQLMSIPGVGVLTAMTFKATIDNPLRFKKSRDVGAYMGLTPRKYSSGEIDYEGHITKCGDSSARTHLFEAAKVMLSRSKKWSALKVWGLSIAKRSSMKNACVAVARKLSIIMHRMWVDGTDFEFGIDRNGVCT